jgi:hypothetical protein
MTRGEMLLAMTRGEMLLAMTRGEMLLAMTEGGNASRNDRGRVLLRAKNGNPITLY